MFKKLFIIILILNLIFIPSVLAHEKNINYIVTESGGTSSSTASGNLAQYADPYIYLEFYDMQQWKGIYSYVCRLDTSSQWHIRDIDIHTSTVDVDYKIGGSTINTGQMQFTRYLDTNGNLKDGILLFTFDHKMDTGATGVQNVMLNYVLADFNIIIDQPPSGGTPSSTNNCPVACFYDYGYIRYFRITDGEGYLRDEFNLNLKSGNISSNLIYLDADRDDHPSKIIIKDKNDEMVYYDHSLNDFNTTTLGTTDAPLTVNITNPIYTGSGDFKFWEYILPNFSAPGDGEPGEPEEPEEGDEVILTHTTLDASNYDILSNVNYDITHYNLTTYIWDDYTSGIEDGTTDIILESSPNKYNLTISKVDYVTSQREFTISASRSMTTYLYPDQGYNYSVTFRVVDINNNPISNIRIIANDVTKFTDDNGIRTFENINDSISYSIFKLGYYIISDTQTINQNIEIPIILEKEYVEEKVILTHTIYDASTYNIISGYYDIKHYNPLSGNWQNYISGYQYGTKDIILESSSNLYNLTITKNNYITTDRKFTISASRSMNSYLYPDQGFNYTVGFNIVDSDNNPLSSIQIIANDLTKYTNYDGKASFDNINATILYTISKPEYRTISGTKIITESQIINIIMILEIEPVITIEPTIPDLEQPSNIMESVKYSFQKILGLTEFEDAETINLIMGLLIILGCTCLIAHVTHNALGAVVGGLIGFVMALALGFIPLWILFVAFASFTIYIILTKTGGE